jgi:hypothetical protein
MRSPLLNERLIGERTFRAPLPASRFPVPVILAALVMIAGVSCKPAAKPSQCLQFSADLMPAFAGGLIQKNLRLANAWAVKSDQMVDSSGVKFPAYFVSADIIAANGEAVPGTWITTEITKPGLIYSLSPQAQKYTSWAKAGDASTAGFTMQSAGAKESVACVLNNRPGGSSTGTTPKTTTP